MLVAPDEKQDENTPQDAESEAGSEELPPLDDDGYADRDMESSEASTRIVKYLAIRGFGPERPMGDLAAPDFGRQRTGSRMLKHTFLGWLGKWGAPMWVRALLA